MTHLDDIAVTPRPEQNGNGHYDKYERDGHEDDEDDAEDGSRALLGSHSSDRRHHAREGSKSAGTAWWPQVKGIVIEVSKQL
jgi:hypothetical protein